MYADALTGGVITKAHRPQDFDRELGNGRQHLEAAPWCREVRGRLDADVQREVLRALLLDSVVPMTVDAQVRDGIVTLSGMVGSEWEREEAKYLASCVPGVLGVADELRLLPASGGDEETIGEAVEGALTRTGIADLADLTVDVPCPGTVVLSGAVTSRSELDLAIASAWSVADVDEVEDCIQVES